MDLVERNRLVKSFILFTSGNPIAVFPMMAIQIDHIRGRSRRDLRGKTNRVGFVGCLVTLSDTELVKSPFAKPGDEKFPKPGRDMFAHRMLAAVPRVKIANQAHTCSIRGPDDKTNTLDPIDRADMGAQLVIHLPVLTLIQ